MLECGLSRVPDPEFLIKERSAMPVLRVVACVLLCLQFAAAQNLSTPQSTTEQPPAAQQPAAPADQSSAKPDSAAKPESAASQQSPETKPQTGQAPAGSPADSAPKVTPALTGFGLEDGTPVKLRLTRNLSSASEKKGDTVDF